MESYKTTDAKIGIIGLGLMGGSIARALTAKTDIKSICAVDFDESSLHRALEDGNITRYSNRIRDLEDCDLIYLCVPVSQIYQMLDDLSSWYKGIITDISSTKEQICSYVGSRYPAMRFVGGHPMAGSEKVVYATSSATLFENAPYILCASRSAEYMQCDFYDADFKFVREFAVKMSAVPIEMDPKEHDAAVGLISHLPHIVAYSLVNSVRSKEDDRLRIIAAGGFKDITRIASSDPSLWADILSNSGDTVVQLLDEYIETLNITKEALRQNDKDTLLKLFTLAKEYRDALPVTLDSKNQPVQLWVEVDDKPGMIGKIAVLFGDHGINIKNMNIQNNRAYEGGSLRITLSSKKDAVSGLELLEKENLAVRIVE